MLRLMYCEEEWQRYKPKKHRPKMKKQIEELLKDTGVVGPQGEPDYIIDEKMENYYIAKKDFPELGILSGIMILPTWIGSERMYEIITPSGDAIRFSEHFFEGKQDYFEKHKLNHIQL